MEEGLRVINIDLGIIDFGLHDVLVIVLAVVVVVNIARFVY